MSISINDNYDNRNYESIAKNQWKRLVPERDILVDCQNTFPKSFVESQSRFSSYQRVRDQSLAMPKHQRRRLIKVVSPKSQEKSKSSMQLYGKRGSIVTSIKTKGRNRSIFQTIE